MSNSPADDFFGISYVSSQQQEEPSTSSPQPQSEKNDSGLGPKQLPGSKFIDDAYFSGLDAKTTENIVPEVISEENGTFFEKQYFRSKLDHLEKSEEPPRQRFKPKPQRKMDRFRATPENNFELEEDESPSGLVQLRSAFTPVWQLNDDELIRFMAGRVIHRDENIIAFDKPYGLAYAGGPPHRPQFDRILQNVKTLVAPKVERLHLVKSLDKSMSGIVLFATNKTLQSELHDIMEQGSVENVYRCLVRDKLEESPAEITIPLVKIIKDKDIKLMPLLSNNTRKEVFHVKTSVRTISDNQYCSLVEAITTKEIPHQVRSHLNLAGCPLIGDLKYGGSNGKPPRLTNRVLSLLDLPEHQGRKIPSYCHLKEVRLPPISRSSAPLKIHSPVPEHFVWILKKLRLLKIRR